MRTGLLCWTTLAALGLGACSGPDRADAATLTMDELLRRADSLLEEDAEAAADDAEDVLQRSSDPGVLQEALFLAGRARQAMDQRKKAYRHYEALMQDYPYSDYLEKIEPLVYQLGEGAIHNEPWWLFGDLFSGRPFGAEVLRQFAATYPFSDRADDALIQIAEYYTSREEFLLAADKFEMVVERYPGSEWFEMAMYREGRSYQLASRGAGYDDTLLRKARRAYLRCLADPNLRERADEVRLGLSETEQSLAEGELTIARFFQLREQDLGARIHFANVALAFPGTPAATEARAELEARGWDLSMNSLDTLQGRIEE